MSTPWLKFFPTDWRADPALRMCSVAARGLWMEMLCVMHEAEPRGSLRINGKAVTDRQLASLAGCPDIADLLIELEEAGVFSREEDGTIYSRRMVRDAEKAAEDKANGKLGGHPDIKRGTVPKEQRVRRFRRSDAPAKAQRIFDRSGGCCHWCQKTLDAEHYHIDHVIAVRDGGANDENNLVASCPDCNVERAMAWGRNDTDLMVGNGSDPKAQRPEARGQEEPSGSSKKRPIQLSEDFAPDLDWAVAQGLSFSEAQTEAAQFKDYWRTKAGKDALKADWPAAWRMWVRNYIKRRAQSPPKKKITTANMWIAEGRDQGILNDPASPPDRRLETRLSGGTPQGPDYASRIAGS